MKKLTKPSLLVILVLQEALQFMVGEYPLRVKIHKYLGRNSNRRTSVSGQEVRCLGKWLLSPLMSLEKSEKEHSTLPEVQSLGWEDRVRLGVRLGKAGAKVRKRFLRKAFIWY